MSKLEEWKQKLLNAVGKEVLIRAVIQAIASYAMAVLSFPKGFCEDLYVQVARFWWTKNGKDKGIN